MKKIILIAVLVFVAIASKAQVAYSTLKSKVDATFPSFPGGQNKLNRYLKKNLKYPKVDLESRVQGTVLVSFIIEKDGSLSNFEIIRNVSQAIDAEALRVVKNSPNWEPAKLDEKPVRVRYTLPVIFKTN